jgi:hypothetical protein
VLTATSLQSVAVAITVDSTRNSNKTQHYLKPALPYDLVQVQVQNSSNCNRHSAVPRLLKSLYDKTQHMKEVRMILQAEAQLVHECWMAC